MSAAALARLLGVSPAAVSYALHGRAGVSDSLRNRILQAATEHGMAVPDDAQAAHSGVLGLILSDVLNPFYSELAISVTDAAREQGHEVFLSNSRDDGRSVAAAVDAMIRHEVDGVLITAIQSDDAGVFRPLRAARIPFVQISRHSMHADADFVGIDDLAAGRDVMEHVISHGYRRIAIVAGPTTSTASRTRAEGFRSALRAHGLPIERRWNLTGGLNETDGARAARYLLDQRTLPQAIVCGTDALALGLITILAAKGLMVPEDVAVTGFDGLTTARTHLVDLTTIVQPRSHMAAEAIALVTERRAHPQLAPRAITCPHHLYIGRSCGCRPRKEKQDV